MTDAPAPTPAPSAIAAPIDWTDPCQRAAALSNAYYSLLSGAQEIEIRTRTLDAEELVKFQPAKLDDLRDEMQNAVDECAAKTAGRPLNNKRFAIVARHKRPRCGPVFGRRYP